MAKKIILFMSKLIGDAEEAKYTCPDGTEVLGTQTNEAPVKYLLKIHPDISEIICIVTNEAKQTAWEHFTNEIRNESPETKFSEVEFDENEDFETVTIPKVLKLVSPTDEIFLETTGGPRNAVMYLLLLSRILQYSGTKLSGAVYSDLGKKEVKNVSHLYGLFDLVNGMQELTNLGNVGTLRKYYGENPEDEKIGALISSLEKLTESITLCRNDIRKRIDALKEALKDVDSCNDPLMRQLIPAFKQKFNGKLGTRSLIRWCVESGMLQQALTVYTERIPYEILRAGDIIQVDDSKLHIPPAKEGIEYKDYRDSDFILFNDYFLTQSFVYWGKKEAKRSEKYIRTIECLEDLLPKSPYKTKRSIAEIQTICLDYRYIVALRNVINHAQSGDENREDDMLDYLLDCGYPDPKEISSEELKAFILKALQHLTKPPKEKK